MGQHDRNARRQAVSLRAVGLGRDQRGAVLLMTVMFLTVVLALAGLATDFARLHVAREDMYTAVDAAALAGSVPSCTDGAVRYIEIAVQPGWCETCCDEDSCWCCCRHEQSVVFRSGPERYRSSLTGQCDIDLGIFERQVKYAGGTERVVRETLSTNWPGLIRRSGRPRVEIHPGVSPYVAVEAYGEMDTGFLRVVGIDKLETRRYSQAATFYERVAGGVFQGRNTPPPDACSSSKKTKEWR